MTLTSQFKKGNTNKTQWLNKMNDTHYDIGLLGSSRAWWNINMNTFNTELELNCINISNNHFPYAEMLLRLKQFYAKGNSIDLLLIQTEYWAFFDQNESFSNTIYNNIPFLDDTATYNYLSKKSSEWIKYKYIPLWRYSEHNRQWGVEEYLITLLNKRNPIYDNTGTFFSNNRFYGQESINFKASDSDQVNPDFIKLYQFCDNHNIRTSIFTAPIYNCKFDLNSQTKMEQQLESLGIVYKNHINTYRDSTFYNDNLHLSINGGKFFTDTLIDFSRQLLNKK
jgi:hypothetical protein